MAQCDVDVVIKSETWLGFAIFFYSLAHLPANRLIVIQLLLPPLGIKTRKSCSSESINRTGRVGINKWMTQVADSSFWLFFARHRSKWLQTDCSTAKWKQEKNLFKLIRMIYGEFDLSPKSFLAWRCAPYELLSWKQLWCGCKWHRSQLFRGNGRVLNWRLRNYVFTCKSWVFRSSRLNQDCLVQS